jgi:hypothetical protein
LAIEIRPFAKKAFPGPEHKDQKSIQGAFARGLALTDLWTGRLVNHVGCGALSIRCGSAVGVRHSFVAGAGRIAVPWISSPTVGPRLTRYPDPELQPCTTMMSNIAYKSLLEITEKSIA